MGRSKIWYTLLPVLLAILLVLAGCAGGDEQEAEVDPKQTIILGDFSWDSVQVHNRVAAFIIEHGYGYPVDYIFGDTLPIVQGLERGDVDASTEIWVNNIREAWDEITSSGTVIDLGANFPDAPQGWYVPTYLIEGDPERGIEPLTPDLKSVFDLPQYWEVFKDPENPNKGRFYNSPPGWVCTDINNVKIEAYGLDEYYVSFTTGSDTALVTSIVSAYEKGEPWVGYYWEPTWVMGMYDMTMLEEPPVDEAAWEAGVYNSAYPASEVNVAVNAELKETAPEIVEFLDNYETTLEQTNRALAIMYEEDADAQKAALWFLNEYRDVWRSWVPGDVAERVEDALNEVS
jgi:glycine betaine/proline transport system substrate-binding protein